MSAPATTEAWHGKQSPKQVTVWESLRPERTGYVYYQWCDTEGLDRFWIILGLDDWDDTWGNNLTPYRIDAAGCVENFEWYPMVNLQFTRTQDTVLPPQEGGCGAPIGCIRMFLWTWWSNPIWSGDGDGWLISHAHLLYDDTMDMWPNSERIQLMAHEFGHSMGLEDHSPNCNIWPHTVMTTFYLSGGCGFSVEPWWPGHYLNDVCVADAYLGYGFTRCQ